LDSLIENRILALQPRLRIDEGHVRLECRFESSPAFGVRIHLVTPGLDVFAESRDHTLRAAFAKAMTQLREQITSRATKRVQRLKSNLSARRGG
jgi:ribosome-associated translation inhibitor RaiA